MGIITKDDWISVLSLLILNFSSNSRQEIMISLSADVGGTFTDVILTDSRTGQSYADKVLSTPGSSDAVIQGIQQLTRRIGIQPSNIDVFVHGFTIASNA